MAGPVLPPAEFQREQAATAQGTLLLVRRQWGKMSSLDDWPRIAAQVTVATSAGQLKAAERGATWTAGTLAELGAADPVGTVNPRAFAGFASDGRPLESQMYSAVAHARKVFIDPAQQLASGRQWVSMLARTMVADAGRSAQQVAITSTPTAGWVRMVNPPCCKDCAVQAGRVFKHNEGFQRHPSCDCVHVPRVGGVVPDGYRDMSDLAWGDIKDLTEAQRKALDDGASLSQVVNAYRGGSSRMLTTIEGTTRRGWSSYISRTIAQQRGEIAQDTATATLKARGAVKSYTTRRTAPRMTPEAIYKNATSREDAVRLLAYNGYLDGVARSVSLATP